MSAPLAVQRVLEGGCGKASDGRLRVVHRQRHTRTVELVHLCISHIVMTSTACTEPAQRPRHRTRALARQG